MSTGGRLRVLVVDDEPAARAETTWLLQADPRVGEVRQAPDGAAALQALEEGEVDAVFADLRMPGLDGLALARVLRRFAAPPALVFVTAHDDGARDAFEVQALDYVLKPLRPDRLAEAVRRVRHHVDAPASSPGSTSGSGRHDGHDPRADAGGAARAAARPPVDADEVVPVELGGRTRFVRRSDITHVEADGGYARLFTRDGSTHLVRTALVELENRWAHCGFVRVHRSRLVSLRHVTELRSEHGRHLVGVAGTVLEVARRHQRDLREALLTR